MQGGVTAEGRGEGCCVDTLEPPGTPLHDGPSYSGTSKGNTDSNLCAQS